MFKFSPRPHFMYIPSFGKEIGVGECCTVNLGSLTILIGIAMPLFATCHPLFHTQQLKIEVQELKNSKHSISESCVCSENIPILGILSQSVNPQSALLPQHHPAVPDITVAIF